MATSQATRPVSASTGERRAAATMPLTRIQRLIGERMLYSKQTKPCYYLEVNADTTEMMDIRHAMKKELGVRITSNAFYIRALAIAVRAYPLMVGQADGGTITIAGRINVGFAVNAPQGLVVPVIRDADRKTLAEITILEKALTEKARDNALTLEEMEGETIALSNLGVYGIDSFFGIVPPPASAILCIGNTIRTIVPRDGQLVARKLTALTVAADNCVINELYAAKFLKHIEDLLARPRELI